MNALRRFFGAYGLGWRMCRLSATRVVVSCAACAAYERLAAFFGAYGLGWRMCRLSATRVVVICAVCAAYERLAAFFRRAPVHFAAPAARPLSPLPPTAPVLRQADKKL